MSQRYLGGIITANPTTPTLASASGVWTLEQQFQYSQTIQPEKIGNSLRFRSSATAYMNRTPATATNRKTWTWSGWVKRGGLGATAYCMFGAGPASNTDFFYLGFEYSGNADQIVVVDYPGSSSLDLRTTSVYRDPSAWYHIVVAVDTTQATSSNRAKIYVNGVQVTAFGTATYPSQNADTRVNSTNVHYVGAARFASSPAYPYDGYMAETYFIDGQALTPSSFGAFDSTGVWQPLPYTGTYGTNGFYLDYGNTTSTTTLGYDTSGNGNNWTTNNISLTAGVTYDSMIDSPSNYADGGNGRGDYPTFNPLHYNALSNVITNANLTAYSNTSATSPYRRTYPATIQVSSGKWYCEVTVGSIANAFSLGIASAFDTNGVRSTFYEYNAYDQVYVTGGSSTAYGVRATAGQVIGVAVDLDAGTLEWFVNNSSQGQKTGIAAGNYFIYLDLGFNSPAQYGDINFGQRPFAYTPPTGFVALNTQNLPAVTINNGAQYMAATLYTGNGATQSINNGANNPIGTTFQPDLVWDKARSTTTSHNLTDSVRGVQKSIFSNSTAAELGSCELTAFNSNGYTLVRDAARAEQNENTVTYVGWQWKKTPTAGFDIVPYTFASTGIATISHNLGTVPKMIIAKRLNAVEQWLVYQSSVTTQSQYLGLNTTAAVASSANLWGSSAFTSSQFYFNATTGYQYIFYLFADVAGYSKIGSYTGNGSSDGTFVYCGFRPRYVMFKRSSSGAGTANWVVVDTSRDTYNLAGQSLEPNLSDAEYTPASSGYPLDILSNGFKQRGSSVSQNESGSTYLYMAFAENPFNIARAR